MAKKEFIVAHPKFSMMCQETGKMKRLEKGARIMLEEEAAKKAERRLIAADESEVIEIETKAKPKAEPKAEPKASK